MHHHMEITMGKGREVYGGNYLNVDDLEGRPLTVTVTGVEWKSMRDGTEKLCIYFQEVKSGKGLLLNKTNWRELTHIAGTDDEFKWGNLRCELYPTTVDYQGKRVACIRIRPTGSAQKLQ